MNLRNVKCSFIHSVNVNTGCFRGRTQCGRTRCLLAGDTVLRLEGCRFDASRRVTFIIITIVAPCELLQAGRQDTNSFHPLHEIQQRPRNKTHPTASVPFLQRTTMYLWYLEETETPDIKVSLFPSSFAQGSPVYVIRQRRTSNRFKVW